MRSFLIGIFGFTIFALPTLAEAEKPTEFLAVYSNMCIHPESGDLLGERMIVFRSGHPFEKEQVWVIYQSGEGVLSEPTFERATIDGNDIRVELHFPPPHNRVQIFVGKITPAAISGRYTDRNDYQPIILLRDNHSENRFPMCG